MITGLEKLNGISVEKNFILTDQTLIASPPKNIKVEFEEIDQNSPPKQVSKRKSKHMRKKSK